MATKPTKKPDLKIVSGAAKIRAENDELPEFDLSNLSWGDTKLGYRAQVLLNKGHNEGDPDKVDEALSSMEQLLARSVISIPRSWLVDSAPDEVDWSDPDSFAAYLRGNRFNDLLTLFNESETPEAASKN